MTHVAASPPAASQLRAQLADTLIADGAVTSPAVEMAVRTVPREAFTPEGTDLDVAYANDIVVTKRDAAGVVLSSISAPWLQARMIEAAALRPGARVLEIGSGGYNAALLAEVVGEHGQVTSLDIDPEIVDRARAALDRAGYSRVQVVCGDGEDGYRANAGYDAILVTAQAADIPPAWLDQLAPHGVLVVPLRIRGNHRTLALVRHGDHLTANTTIVSGFVAMQGAGAYPPRTIGLRGDGILLRIDDPVTDVDAAALGAAIEQPRLDSWSQVTTAPGVPFDTLHLWLGTQPDAYGLLAVDSDHAGQLADAQNRIACPTLLTDDSLAYLATRRLDAQTWQFGAHGFGPHAATLTARMLDLITDWDRDFRHGPGPTITVHPAGFVPGPAEQPRLVLRRRHTTIVITWSTSRRPA